MKVFQALKEGVSIDRDLATSDAARGAGSGVAGVATATPVWNVVWHRYGLAIPVFLVHLGLLTEMFAVWKQNVSATYELSTLYC